MNRGKNEWILFNLIYHQSTIAENSSTLIGYWQDETLKFPLASNTKWYA